MITDDLIKLASNKDCSLTNIEGIEGIAPSTGLVGFSVQKGILPSNPNSKKTFVSLNKSNILRNQILLQWATHIELDLEELNAPLIRIKGAALGSQIYSTDSERTFSDIDFLISNPEDEKTVKEYLLQQGFQLYPQKKWKANFNRNSYNKSITPFLTVTIDIHSSLIWDEPEGWNWKTLDDYCHLGHKFTTLESSDHFLYLCYNWVVQDNFCGLYKFIDLIRLTEKYSATWNWELIFARAKELKIEKSVNIVIQLINHFEQKKHPLTPLRLKNNLIQKIVQSDFLTYPRSQPFLYLFLRWKTRDSFLLSANYHIEWIRAYQKEGAKYILSLLGVEKWVKRLHPAMRPLRAFYQTFARQLRQGFRKT